MSMEGIENLSNYSNQLGLFLGIIFIALILWLRFKLQTKKCKNLNNDLEDSLKKIAQLENELEAARKTIINCSKMAVLGEIAGGIAHEINNPLAVITMRSQHVKHILTTPNPNLAQVKTFIEVIESTAYRISQIVYGMKNFSRNSDKDPLKATAVDGIIKDAISLCAEKLKNNSVDLQLDIADQSTAIACRSSQICQVILNLVMNANDAISSQKTKWIRVSVKNTQDGFVLLSITDSGLGIPEAVAESIFQPFFTTKDIGKGTGLGLSISRAIVEEHNGVLALDKSSPNTSFTMKFPTPSG